MTKVLLNSLEQKLLEVEAINLGPAATHRYVSGGLTIASLAESIAVLAIEGDQIMQVVSMQATFETG